ncbi:hypothetical protein MLD38_024466 [Melastoma candidum]|uniref:Uncharacterized protein n=1 Tax=Melastoma candidum TaxID=119954 RepID=A0ACB9NVD5_9MYRT|nr:hypothetical protein MLD38_024466 [Melastoma candidum]
MCRTQRKREVVACSPPSYFVELKRCRKGNMGESLRRTSHGYFFSTSVPGSSTPPELGSRRMLRITRRRSPTKAPLPSSTTGWSPLPLPCPSVRVFNPIEV